jgi:hypothetical protein
MAAGAFVGEGEDDAKPTTSRSRRRGARKKPSLVQASNNSAAAAEDALAQQQQQPNPSGAPVAARPKGENTSVTPTADLLILLTSLAKLQETGENKEIQKRDFVDFYPRLLQGAYAVASDSRGCRYMQWLLEQRFLLESDKIRTELVTSAFQGHVKDAVDSPHANHVLQLCIEILPPKSVSFIPEELLAWKPAEIAKHRFGCRVLERLIEHFRLDDEALRHRDCDDKFHEFVLGQGGLLVEETTIVELCKHQYANFVVQHLLEHGGREIRKRIVWVLLKKFREIAKDKNGVVVIEKAMWYVHPSDQLRMAIKMVGEHNLITELLNSSLVFGGASILLRALVVLKASNHHQEFAMVVEEAKKVDIRSSSSYQHYHSLQEVLAQLRDLLNSN